MSPSPSTTIRLCPCSPLARRMPRTPVAVPPIERAPVDDRAAGAIRAGIRQLVDLEPEHTTGAGEGEQRVVRGEQPQPVDEVFFLDRGGGTALAAALLRAVGGGRLALGVAGVR